MVRAMPSGPCSRIVTRSRPTTEENDMRPDAIVLLVLLGAVSPLIDAADDAKQRQDLTAVIALNGTPCGEVVSYTVQGDNDFVATCKDGNRYRVYVKDARVVVEKKLRDQYVLCGRNFAIRVMM